MKNKDVEFAVLMALFLGPLTIILMCAGYLLRGYVLSILWEWFISSQFNLPTITALHGIGISIIFYLLTYHYKDCKPSEDSNTVKLITSLAHTFLSPIFILLIGWIVKGCM